MTIILSALEFLHSGMKSRELFGMGNDKWPFTMDDVDGLLQSFDNSEQNK